MELIGIAFVALVVAAFVAQLNRTHRRMAANRLDPRTRHELDRDLERIRADVLAPPDRLAQRSLWAIRPSPLTGTDEWTRRA